MNQVEKSPTPSLRILPWPARREMMMPTFTTDRGDEITVSERLIAKMAERMGRRMSPERRARYMENARRRLAGAHPSRSDAAAVFAAGE